MLLAQNKLGMRASLEVIWRSRMLMDRVMFLFRGNLEGCLGWKISEEDMRKLSTLDFQLRLVDGIRFLRPEGPFR